MPAGLQIWDSNGNIVIDTSTSILKSTVISMVSATTTAEQTINTTIPAGTTLAGANAVSGNGSGSGARPPDVEIDAVNSRLKYKFSSTGGHSALVQVLNF